jgi:ketosteroid isomerase-like protein
MSQTKPLSDKRALLEAVAAAINARDFDALADMPFHPDMELRSVIAAAEGGVYHGIQGLRDWAHDIDSAFEEFSIRIVEFREVDDERVLAVLHNSGTAKASGVPIEQRTHAVCTWRNGLMWRNDIYSDLHEALDAVGLSE